MESTEIFKKLKFDPAKKNLIINAPEDYLKILSGIKYNSSFNKKDANSFDFIQVFGATEKELNELLAPLSAAGKYDCLFWICYPKGGGKIKSDLKRDKIWEAFKIVNLRPVSQIAIDNTWSALRGRPEEVVGK